MQTMLAVFTPYYAFEQSDWVGRIIVLVLFVASVFAWTIIIEKWLYLRGVRRQVAESLRYFQDAASPTEVFLHLESLRGPIRRIAEVLLEHVGVLQRKTPTEMLASLRHQRGAPARLSDAETQRLRAVVETAVDNEVLRLEARLAVLGSIVGASPFLGLLGTVWGVMAAFCGMAIVGQANIGAIAPGVSGALLTTVVGLLVAIPALICYNILVSTVKLLTIKMDNFAAELLTWLRSDNPGAGDPQA